MSTNRLFLWLCEESLLIVKFRVSATFIYIYIHTGWSQSLCALDDCNSRWGTQTIFNHLVYVQGDHKVSVHLTIATVHDVRSYIYTGWSQSLYALDDCNSRWGTQTIFNHLVYIQGDHKVSVHLTIAPCIYIYIGWSQSLCTPDDCSTVHDVHRHFGSPCIYTGRSQILCTPDDCSTLHEVHRHFWSPCIYTEWSQNLCAPDDCNTVLEVHRHFLITLYINTYRYVNIQCKQQEYWIQRTDLEVKVCILFILRKFYLKRLYFDRVFGY